MGEERPDAHGGAKLRLVPLPFSLRTSPRQRCARCAAPKKLPHRVCMSFQTQSGWRCQFLEGDLKTPIPVRLNLLRKERLFEIAERGGYQLNLEGRHALERAVETGRGGIWLEPSEEHYQKLKRER